MITMMMPDSPFPHSLSLSLSSDNHQEMQVSSIYRPNQSWSINHWSRIMIPQTIFGSSEHSWLAYRSNAARIQCLCLATYNQHQSCDSEEHLSLLLMVAPGRTQEASVLKKYQLGQSKAFLPSALPGTQQIRVPMVTIGYSVRLVMILFKVWMATTV